LPGRLIDQVFGREYQAGCRKTLDISGMKSKTTNIDTRVGTALREVLAYDGAAAAVGAVIVGAIILFVLWWAT
jgi:hypothetical protein